MNRVPFAGLRYPVIPKIFIRRTKPYWTPSPKKNRWIRKAQDHVQFQGLPSRICWLEYGERAEMGAKFNWLVKKGKVDASLVIGRDHLDTGSVASPNRETEDMKDGSDTIADWPLLNAMLNTASGASWVSLHHGGGVGIGGQALRARVNKRSGQWRNASR